MQLCSIIYCSLTAIHVLSNIFAHHQEHINPLNTELNPICHLLALLGAHHILHVSRVRVKSLVSVTGTLRAGWGQSVTGTGKSHSYAFLSVQCFLLYSCAFSAITIPMGGTPAIKQEASKEMVLYALAILMLISLCALCSLRRFLCFATATSQTGAPYVKIGISAPS